MCAMLLSLVLSWLGATDVNTASSAVELKPNAIALDSPPTEETQRSCVIYDRDGGMNVLAAAANDPAIGVDLREGSVPGLWVVTATLPAGYRPVAGSQTEIRVETDLAAEPVVGIPVRVWTGPLPVDMGWLAGPRALIGRTMPTVVLDGLEGGRVTVGPVKGKVTVVVFAVNFCGHCDHYMPLLGQVGKEYAQLDVQFLGVAPTDTGDKANVDAADSWGVDWPIGSDRAFKVAEQLGVRAFPVVFVIDREGIVQAVHGRRSNRGIHNGMDNVDVELRGEIDTLLLGRTRADFPKVEASPKPVVTTRPAAERPASAAVKMAEVRAATCKPGATAVFSVPVRNVGMRPLNLLKVGADEGVKIGPAAVTEVAPNGVAVLRCEVLAPAQAGPFARQVTIETNDPRMPVVKVALSGTVSERRVAAGTHDQTADSAQSVSPLMPTQLERETMRKHASKGYESVSPSECGTPSEIARNSPNPAVSGASGYASIDGQEKSRPRQGEPGPLASHRKGRHWSGLGKP